MPLEPLDHNEYEDLVHEGRALIKAPMRKKLFERTLGLTSGLGFVVGAFTFNTILKGGKRGFFPGLSREEYAMVLVVCGVLVVVPHLIRLRKYHLSYLLGLVLLLGGISTIPFLLLPS
ncbi:MAG: hypothetical protein KIS92_15485 [Planctomycetota bacterium]|nr:hypothetical protein [Planctomycetota bacterium]